MNASALDILDAELTALAQAKVDALTAIERAQGRLAEIEIQVRVVEKVRQQIHRAKPETDDSETYKPGPTEAVLDYLRHHPGSHGTDVVAAVSAMGIKTASQHRDRLLFNTIHALLKKGKIVRADKVLSLAEETEKVTDKNGIFPNPVRN